MGGTRSDSPRVQAAGVGGKDAGNGQDRSRIGCLGATWFGRGRLLSGVCPAEPINFTRTSLACLDVDQGAAELLGCPLWVMSDRT
jgi:hypothetical protein